MKMVYVLSVLMLAGAGLLAVACAGQWSQGTQAGASASRNSLLDPSPVPVVHRLRGPEEITSPLVAQALAFALYLDPPKPPEPKVAAPPRVAPPVSRPPVVAPKFRLLAISYYASHPEKSLAMVSEPGKGSYWIRQGDRVGHLIVERILDGAIVYRDGEQSHEMKVDVRESVPFARLKSTASASAVTRAARAEDR